MRFDEHDQGDVLVYRFPRVQEVARVTEEQVVGRRSRNSQPIGFGRLNLQFSVDHFVQSLSAAALVLSATSPNIAD